MWSVSQLIRLGIEQSIYWRVGYTGRRPMIDRRFVRQLIDVRHSSQLLRPILHRTVQWSQTRKSKSTETQETKTVPCTVIELCTWCWRTIAQCTTRPPTCASSTRRHTHPHKYATVQALAPHWNTAKNLGHGVFRRPLLKHQYFNMWVERHPVGSSNDLKPYRCRNPLLSDGTNRSSVWEDLELSERQRQEIA